MEQGLNGLKIAAEIAEKPVEWEVVARMGEKRAEHAAAVWNEKIYVFGGVGEDGKTKLASVEAYDSATNRWTLKASIPKPRTFFGFAVIGKKAYIVGGEEASSLAYETTIFAYDFDTDTWERKTSFGVARRGFGTVVADGKIYILGGVDSSNKFLNTVECYDPVTDICTEKAPMKSETYRCKAIEMDAKIYVVGGAAGMEIQEYDIATDTWKLMAPTNKSKSNLSAVIPLNHKIYMIGAPYIHYTSELEVYDPATNTCTVKRSPDPKKGRSSGECILFQDKICFVGGATDKTSVPYFQIYNAKEDKWENGESMIAPRKMFSLVVVNNEIYAVGGLPVAREATNTVEKYNHSQSTGIRLTAVGGKSSIQLNWSVASGVSGYNVYRSTTSGGTYTKIAENVTETSYADNNVEKDMVYYYVVTGETAEGETGYSNEASAQLTGTTEPDPGPDPEPGAGMILEIFMLDGTKKEFEVSANEVKAFLNWFDEKGSGKAYYRMKKPYPLGAYETKEEYLVFDKIRDFQISK